MTIEAGAPPATIEAGARPKTIEPGRRPRIAVIVPATNAPPTLETCLAALRGAGVDEGQLFVETSPAGTGPAAARNAAAARADADVLVFVDADVVVHDDAIEGLRERFGADPSLVAVFGAYDDDPAAPGLVSQFRNLLHHYVHVRSPGEAETFWAGLGAVRRDAFVAAGGFDAERYPRPAVEDIELGRRLRARGGRIVLEPAVQGTHLKRWTLIEMTRTDLLRRGVPWARLQLEERQLAGSLNLGVRERVSALFALLVAVSAPARRPRTATASVAADVALNSPLFDLLARRGGPRLAIAGVPLLLVHQLTALAAFVIAFVSHAAAGFPGRSEEVL